MRCHHCSSGRIKRAENYGADRMQCGSCGIVTKQAHHSLTEKQQALINYLSNWNSERIENSREAPQQLSQLGVAAAIDIHRSNVNRVVAPLIRDGLVKQKLAHVTDEDGRVFGRMKKTVYYLTRDGYQHVTESRRAETFEASRSDLRRRRRTPFYEIERPEAEEDYDVNRYARTNAGGALWEATYQALRDEGRSHAQAEAFCNSKFFDHYYEALIEGLRRPMRKVLKDIRRANRKAGRNFDKTYLIDEFIFDDKVFNAHEMKSGESFEADERMYLGVQVSKRGDKYYYLQINDRNIGDRFAILEFNKDWKMGGHEKPHWELGMDDGRFVTVKSFNEGIKRFKRMSTEYLSPSRSGPPVGTYAHTAAWLANAGLMTGDEADRWKDEMKERDAESFEAHEGGHFEEIHYESDTYPLNPTRPSGPWPTPSPRPRRPNRRPNRRPSPRPQRRPF